jgi:hypothetical protein
MQGEKPLVQGTLHTETFLTMFAANNAYASQAGTHGLGALRYNVTTSTSSKPIDPVMVCVCSL